MLKLTASRETLIHLASGWAKFTKAVDIGQCYITNDSVVDGNSCTAPCREDSEARNFLDIQDYKQLLTIT